ncbi:conserved hypothetical protein [Vibrio phage 424E50-1]|nr:conserved hypothetical protein [Vibrio phage 424E50-1]
MTEEELDPRSKDSYPDLYQWRHNNLWQDAGGYNDEGVKVQGYTISYWVPKTRGQSYDITSWKVFKPPVYDFEVLMDTKKAMSLLVDRIFTGTRTVCSDGKKRRITPRKEFLAMKEYEQYDYIAIMEYLKQCTKEGSKKCLLSKKEASIIAKPVTKKEAIKRRMARNVIGY